jgi:hypothetical protein
VSEQAAVAAIEQACRMLWLPMIRDQFTEIAATAQREQLSYLEFLAELVMAECDDRDQRRARRSSARRRLPEAETARRVVLRRQPGVLGQLATRPWGDLRPLREGS